MALKSIRRFDKGIWVTPSADEIPDGALRRARGISPIQREIICSKDGMNTLYLFEAHSITRFADNWVFGVSTSVYVDDDEIVTGLDGEKLSFASMSPTSGVEDYLFCCGGGDLFKLDDSSNETDWGITPPADGMTAELAADSQKSREIDLMNSSPHSSWVASGDVWSGSPTTDTTVKYEGTSSLKCNVLAVRRGTLLRTLASAIDLENFFEVETGTNSGDSDTVMTDAGASFTPDALIGGIIENTTDGSSGLITDNDGTTVTVAALAGGTANAWANTDEYEISNPSTDTDFIEFAVWQPLNVIEYIELRLKTDANSFFSKRYTFGDPAEYPIETPSEGVYQALAVIYGLDVALELFKNIEAEASANRAKQNERIAKAQTAQQLKNIGGWQLASTEKAAFVSNGPAPDWGDITYVEVEIFTRNWVNDTVDYIYLDTFRMIGGYPMNGTYQYKITYLNSKTGTRSNANETALRVNNVTKQQVTISSIPNSSDNQVDTVEIWRTLADGAVFFKCSEIADAITGTHTGDSGASVLTDSTKNWLTDSLVGRTINNTTDGSSGTITANTSNTVTATLSGGTDDDWDSADAYTIVGETSFLDGVADFPDENVTSYLESEVLPTDNLKPYDYFEDCFGPWNASMFWISRTEEGERGRVYYSPIGRAEAVQGFIDVGSDDDPLQKLIAYRNSLFVVSESKWYEIFGSNPYQSREVAGAPGTTKPHTVVESPYGIIYLANDGVRIFDGLQSTLISDGPVDSIFRGWDEEDLDAVTATIGCYARGEYFLGGE